MLNPYWAIRRMSVELGIRWHFLAKVSKLKCEHLQDERSTKQGIPEETANRVQDFYHSPSVSVALGGMKNVNKRGVAV